MSARGWAVAVKGEIDLKTVGPTRRSALVNWLHVHRGPIRADWSDKLIEGIWSAVLEGYPELGLAVAEVKVEFLVP